MLYSVVGVILVQFKIHEHSKHVRMDAPSNFYRDRSSSDRLVVRFTSTYAISAFHH